TGIGVPLSGRSENRLAQVNSKLDEGATTYSRNVRERATTANLATKGASLLRHAELPAFADLNIGRQPLRGSLAGEQQIRADQSISLLDVHTIDYSFCVPEAPLKSQQKRTACHMLQLLRTCRNILGFTNELLPPLRFDALLRLARNFTDLAQAAERDLLNFRQQFEQESFSL